MGSKIGHWLEDKSSCNLTHSSFLDVSSQKKFSKIFLGALFSMGHITWPLNYLKYLFCAENVVSPGLHFKGFVSNEWSYESSTQLYCYFYFLWPSVMATLFYNYCFTLQNLLQFWLWYLNLGKKKYCNERKIKLPFCLCYAFLITKTTFKWLIGSMNWKY